MKKLSLVAICLLSFLAVGCKAKITQEDATKALLESGVFNEPIEMRVYIGPTGLDCNTMRGGNAAVLQAAGYIVEKNRAYQFTDEGKKAFDAVGAKIIEKRRPFVGDTDNVTCEDVQWQMSLAHKKLHAVPVIQVDGRRARIQYSYEWQANEVGKHFVEGNPVLDQADKLSDIHIAPTIVPGGEKTATTYLRYNDGVWKAE